MQGPVPEGVAIPQTRLPQVTGAGLSLRELRYDLRAGEPLFSATAIDIAAGTFTVLTGPSGSGKTTLLYLLAGMLTATTGQVKWDDTDLSRLSGPARDRWRRQRAGFVFQDFHLIPELSPIENVLAPAWFSNISARPFRDRAAALLARFGVPDRRRTAVLSRGEQQRVALARALLLEPAVIFADEPTASLDAAAAAEVTSALCALARDEGRSVIAASHDAALIGRADRRLSLQRGAEVLAR